MRTLPIILAATLAFTGCTAAQLQTDNAKIVAAVPTAAQDAQLVATGLSSVVAAIGAIPGVPAADVVKAQALLVTIKADAAALAGGLPPGNSAIVADVQAVVAILVPLAATIPGAAPYLPLIQAAVALAPEVVAAGTVAVQVATSARAALKS